MAELVDSRKSANIRMIADGDVATESRAVGQDDMIANLTIVSDVCVGEQGAVIADACRGVGFCTTMNADKFSDGISSTDASKGYRISYVLLVD